MPARMRPDDWDRLFAPNAPRRGGPLRALANVLISLLVLALLAGGSVFVVNLRGRQVVSANATATVVAATYYPLYTATAETLARVEATRVANRTATAIARTPQATLESTIGIGVVTQGGNLRSEPRIADNTVIGLVYAGDQVTFLEQRQVGDQTWFRIRLTRPADNRAGVGVSPGTAGWASAVLVSPPTPIPSP